MLDVSAQNKNLTTLHILRGENPLLESIAKIVGVSRSRLSQLSQSLTEGGYRQIKKMLVLLVKAISCPESNFELYSVWGYTTNILGELNG